MSVESWPFKAKLWKQGNSLLVTIPSEFVKSGAVKEGEYVDMSISSSKDLRKIPTCDLVTELRKREGVEGRDVLNEEHMELLITDNDGGFERKMLDGPAIIFIIID